MHEPGQEEHKNPVLAGFLDKLCGGPYKFLSEFGLLRIGIAQEPFLLFW